MEVQIKNFKFSNDYEDIHMNVEMALKKNWKTCRKDSHRQIKK